MLVMSLLSACQSPIRIQVVTAAQVAGQALAAAPTALPVVAVAVQPGLASQPAAPVRAGTAAAPGPAGQAPTSSAEPLHAAPLPAHAGRATAVPPAPASRPPTRIVAPAIGLDAPVVTMGWAPTAGGGPSEWQLPDAAAGFHADSALPGRPGNTVLSGHHNIKGMVFARLYRLKTGDAVDLYAGEQVYHYRVEDSFILPERGVSDEQRRQNAGWIAATGDERLTLVTCWPPDDNSHRVIVIARPTP